MKTRVIRIDGMTCPRCAEKAEKALCAAEGVESAQVSYTKGSAEVSYDSEKTSLDALERVIEAAGYTPRDGQSAAAQSATAHATAHATAQSAAGQRAAGTTGGAAVGLIAVIIGASIVINHFGGSLITAFPTAKEGAPLLFMFIIGLITSLHCVAMCGGINLSQCLKGSRESGVGSRQERDAGKNQSTEVYPGSPKDFREKTDSAETQFPKFPIPNSLFPSFLYNAGRVISYTAVGALVGALGQGVSFSGRARGVVQIAAGAFMVVMGINMLGLFPALRTLTPRLPRFLTTRLDRLRGRGPLVVGLLNGLMPCGPLQAMQLYALSTGSPAKGAIAMLLFSLGTVPLMFGLGSLGSFLSSRPAITRRVMTAGACVVAICGITMFTQGAALSGLSLDSFLPQKVAASSSPALSGNTAKVSGNVQTLTSSLEANRFPAITVLQNVPVKWTIEAAAGSINGCNSAIVIPEYGLQYRFKTGENVIEFVPEKAGKFRYSCWMGMIRGTITVVESEAALKEAASAPETPGTSPLAPVPSGYTVPTDEFAVARLADYQGNIIQRVEITLDDDGFSPAVVVVQTGVPAEWVIDNRSDEAGSGEIRVPAYTTRLPLQSQAKNPLYLRPDEDFVFSTADGVFFGYVRVVADIGNFDEKAARRAASESDTSVYPDEFYEQSIGGGGCCGR